MSLSCEKATELIEKQTITTLSFNEKIKLRVHLNLCKKCYKFKVDSEKMDSFFQNRTPSTTRKIELSEEIKQQIIEKSK